MKKSFINVLLFVVYGLLLNWGHINTKENAIQYFCLIAFSIVFALFHYFTGYNDCKIKFLKRIEDLEKETMDKNV